MFSKKLALAVVLMLSVAGAHAQALSETRQLVSGQPIERDLAAAASHVYSIALQTGQFARLRLDQRAMNAALVLIAPDGKQLAEMDLTTAGEHELLSFEAASTGNYQLTVRSNQKAQREGSYRGLGSDHPSRVPQRRGHRPHRRRRRSRT